MNVNIKLKINKDTFKNSLKSLNAFASSKTKAVLSSDSEILKEHIKGIGVPVRDPFFEPNKTKEAKDKFIGIVKQNIKNGISKEETMMQIAEQMREDTYQAMNTGGNGAWTPYSKNTKQSRQAKGLQTGIVDLQDTGKMKKSIKASIE